MTTTFAFSSTTQLPFTFQPVLDGVTYNAVISWNVFAQRAYINLYQLDGTLVFCLPLIGTEAQVDLVALSWSNGLVTATLDTSSPQDIRIYASGTVTDLTISGASPDAYNGEILAQILTHSTFQYPLAVNPGPATAFGTSSYDISLTGGYFDSTLVYRPSAQVIEVNP